ncbi:MAG TPA: iron-containing redox enzyme family protein [Luteibacter sp.]|nr:iron-containing redox enzyme family protein [Luteibacter sp.]
MTRLDTLPLYRQNAYADESENTPPPLDSAWLRWLAADDLTGLANHPLLRALARGEVGLDLLRTLLVQHALYSRHFTRFLVALIGNLDNPDDARRLYGNLQEEMGLDGEGLVTHAEMFQRSLRIVGADTGQSMAYPSTQLLVDSMLAHCRSADPLSGLAALCLGAEAIVPLLYRPIRAAMAMLGFGEDAQVFFTLHIEEDEAHAITMRQIMERLIGNDDAREAQVRQVGSQMIALRVAMLDAVWQQRDIPRASSRGKQSTGMKSSGDFAAVAAQPTASMPDRLHHPRVIDAETDASKHFSADRRHAVHIVDLPSHTLSMTLGRLRPGEATRPHRHNYETIIYVIEGEGHSHIGGREVAWTAGDAFYVPAWAVHRHRNTGSQCCLYVACENAPLLQNLGGIAVREELEAADAITAAPQQREHV